MRTHTRYAIAVLVLAGSVAAGAQQATNTLQRPPDRERTFSSPEAYVPDLTQLTASTSELRDTVDRFATDRQALLRFHNIPGSRARRERLQGLYAAWLTSLPEIAFEKLSQEGKVDYVLLRNHLEYQSMLLGREERTATEIAPLVPFADEIVELQDDRQRLQFITADEAAAAVARLTAAVTEQCIDFLVEWKYYGDVPAARE